MAVLLVWGRLFPAKRPPAAVPELAAEAGQTEGGNDVGTAAEQVPAVVSEALPPTAMLAMPAAEPAVKAVAEQRVTLENEAAVAEFSNRGGQLVSFRLKGHAAGDGGVLDLVRARGAGPYPLGLVGAKGLSLPINEALFQVAEEPDGPWAITFLYNGEEGWLRKRFSFADDGLLKLEVESRGLEAGWALLVGPGIGNPSANETASKLAKRGGVYSSGGDLVSMAAQSSKEVEVVPGSGLGWVGLDDNYFLSVLLVESPLAEARYVPGYFQDEPGQPGRRFTPLPANGEMSREQKAFTRDLSLEVRPTGDKLSASLYLGAKELNRLLALDRGLDRTIELGWFRFLALPFMHALQWIFSNVVANYGWAIVLMTTLIKILLLPLTHTTMVSMGKMQELAPKIQGIRSKYATKMKDKQGRPNFETQKKINEETMALYKAEGVNPAGGCLPMLLQLPVFIAFYNILPASIELRQAPWILWVRDLSAHDPIYILPIVMGATQLLQMLMTPAAGNPMQRRMMLMMPVVFTVMFLGFPAGLVLYWLTNNVLSIVQQVVYNRLKKAKAVQMV